MKNKVKNEYSLDLEINLWMQTYLVKKTRMKVLQS